MAEFKDLLRAYGLTTSFWGLLTGSQCSVDTNGSDPLTDMYFSCTNNANVIAERNETFIFPISSVIEGDNVLTVIIVCFVTPSLSTPGSHLEMFTG